MKIGRSLRGAPHSASSPGRLTAGARPEIDDICHPQARTHPPSTCPEYLGLFIPSCGRMALGLLHVGNLLPLAERVIAGDRLRHVRLRSRKFFVSRPQPGSYPTHDGADAFHAPEYAWSASQCLVPGRSEKFGL
jgi:hypothetical protein